MFMPRTLLVWAVLPLCVAASRQEAYKARVDESTKTKVTVTEYRPGDSIERPTGGQVELVLDGQTKYLNVKGEEVKDAANKGKILSSGAVILVKSAQKDGKATAVSLQAVGG